MNIMKIFKKKEVKIVEVEKPTIIVEYRIREVKFYDGRTEFFAEGVYSDEDKWSNIGDTFYIALDKGYNTMKEAEDRIEKKKQFYKNPSGIIEEKIYTK